MQVRQAGSGLSQDFHGLNRACVAFPLDVIRKRSLAELQSYVAEHPVLLHAVVANHVRMGIAFAQQSHLSVREVETFRQQTFHRHFPVVEFPPEVEKLKKRFACVALDFILVYKSAFASFPQQVIGMESNFPDAHHTVG